MGTQRLQLLSDYNYVDDSEEVKQEIVNVGLKYSLLSKYTSFIAVDEKSEKVVNEINQSVKNPGNPGAVPEPHEWALIFFGTAFMIYLYAKSRIG